MNQKEKYISQDIKTKLNVFPFLVTLCTYALLSAALSYGNTIPILAGICLLFGITSIVLYAQMFIKTNYIFYIAYGVNNSMKNFSQNLLKQIKSLHVAAIPPVLITASSKIISKSFDISLSFDSANPI